MYTVIIEKLKGRSVHKHLSKEEAAALIRRRWRDDWEFWVANESFPVFWNVRDNPCF